jgi:hypothetical protein
MGSIRVAVSRLCCWGEFGREVAEDGEDFLIIVFF